MQLVFFQDAGQCSCFSLRSLMCYGYQLPERQQLPQREKQATEVQSALWLKARVAFPNTVRRKVDKRGDDLQACFFLNMSIFFANKTLFFFSSPHRLEGWTFILEIQPNELDFLTILNKEVTKCWSTGLMMAKSPYPGSFSCCLNDLSRAPHCSIFHKRASVTQSFRLWSVYRDYKSFIS